MTPTRTSLAAASSLAALCLAACGTSPPAAPAALNPIAHFEMKTEAATDQIALAPHADGLSAAQVEALKAMTARRTEADGGAVTLSLPHGAADASVVGHAADQVQGVLNVAGLSVTRATYESGDPKAPLLVSFRYERAKVQACGSWDELTRNPDNEVYANFGCAVTANMAAQIANPADIDHPRAEGPADAARRATVLDKYRAGKVTGADAPSASADIAHVGQ